MALAVPTIAHAEEEIGEAIEAEGNEAEADAVTKTGPGVEPEQPLDSPMAPEAPPIQEVNPVIETEKPKRWRLNFWPGPSYTAANLRFSVHLDGRVLLDGGYVKDKSSVGSASDWTTNVRVVRIGASGRLGKSATYRVNAAINNNDFEIQDARIDYVFSKSFAVRVGQYKMASSLESITSILNIDLVERASFINAFGLKRSKGLGARFARKNWSLQAGVYTGSNFNDDTSEEKLAFASRFAFYPKFGASRGLSMAISYRYRKFDQKEGTSSVQYRQRAHTRLTNNFYVDTGVLENIASDHLIIAELGAAFDSVWLSSEWGLLRTDPNESNPDLPGPKGSLNFHGGYVGVGWFLTGETRQQGAGRWRATKVLRPVFKGGWGALALVARLDYINLVDKKELIFGGRQISAIGGVNWHLNDYLAVKLNYSHSKVDKALGAPRENGLVNFEGKNRVNTVIMRLQAHF